MKLGVMQGVIDAETDLARFEIAKELGFSGIEPDLSRRDMTDSSAGRLASLQKAREKTGLEIPSICFGGYHGLIAKPQPTAPAIKEILTGMDWARALGAKTVLIPFFGDGELKTQADFNAAVAGFRELCAKGQSLGVTAAYEGTYGAEMSRRLAESIASPAFGIYFDLANVVWLGMDGPAEILAMRELIRQVHFKETRVGPGDCHPGQGRVKYDQSAAALKTIGYDSWLVFETPTGSREEIARDIAFARRFFTVT